MNPTILAIIGPILIGIFGIAGFILKYIFNSIIARIEKLEEMCAQKEKIDCKLDRILNELHDLEKDLYE